MDRVIPAILKSLLKAQIIKLVTTNIQPPSGGFLLLTFKSLQARSGRVLRATQNQALKSALESVLAVFLTS